MASTKDPALNDNELAASLVRGAGELARAIRADGLDTLRAGRHIKNGVADFATDADYAAEKYVFDTLRAARPDDSILGEEGASHVGNSGRCWVIDPVDGTFNFASGSSYWCAALALVCPDVAAASGPEPVAASAATPWPSTTPDPLANAEVLLGAVFQPEEDKLWLGGTMHPTTLNGAAIRVSESALLGELSAGTYIHPGWLSQPQAAVPWQRAAEVPATLRMLGSGSCDLSRVAQGQLGLWFQHSCPSWDWLPGKGIVEAAGGDTAVVRVNGLDWYVAGPSGAVEELVAALRSGAILA